MRNAASAILAAGALAAAMLPSAGPGRAPPAAPSPVARDPGRGPALYALHCSPCHGERGRGDGPAGRFLDPEPRDFTAGQHRLVTTTNGVPSDKDLFEVISAGLPGTAMLGFPQLPPDERYAIIEVLRDFRRQGLRDLYRPLAEDAAELEAWVRAETTPGDVIGIGPETPDTVDSRARGRASFRALCAPCHGVLGRGDAMPIRTDTDDRPVRPRDFTRGVLKGGVESINLVSRIRCGMPGTPMPAVPPSSLGDAGVWDVVHYLRTLIPAGAQELHDPVGWPLRAARARGPLPADAGDPAWKDVPEVHVVLAPFRAPEATVPGVLVRALHDGEHVAFRIVYPDATRDVPAADHATPPDGFAVRITALERPPVLPIPGQPLPLDRALWLAGTMPPEEDALFDAVEPRFRNPDNVCKAPIGPEKVGQGSWRDGLWTLVMPVKPSRAGEIAPGRPFHVSFAAFDGSLARGPLPVAFSAWHELTIE